MNTHEINLPPLPAIRYFREGSADRYVLPYGALFSLLRSYAHAAIKADRLRNDTNVDYKELFEQMCKRCDRLDESLAYYKSQRKGEPVMPPVWLSDQIGGVFDGITPGQGYRMGWNDCRNVMKKLSPRPTEPVIKESDEYFNNDGDKLRGLIEPGKVPSVPADIISSIQVYGDARADNNDRCVEILGEVVKKIRALLARYGPPTIPAEPVEKMRWPADFDGVHHSATEGWQLVPKVPTHEMINALWVTITRNHDTTDGGYTAMLAAAPKFGEEE